MRETILGPPETGKLQRNNEINGAALGIIRVTGITALPVLDP